MLLVSGQPCILTISSQVYYLGIAFGYSRTSRSYYLSILLLMLLPFFPHSSPVFFGSAL
jgi:hypothetical protein